MTYNVRYFGHGTRGMVATPAGVRAIARTIANLQPLCDVICLQEVEDRSLRSTLSLGRTRPRPQRRYTFTGTRAPGQLHALLGELDRELLHRGERDYYQALYFPAHSYRLTQSTNLYTTGLAMLVHPRLRIVDHNADSPWDITHRRGVKGLKQTRICAHVRVEHPSAGQLDVFNTHMSLPGWLYPEFWLGEARLGFGPNQVHEARRLVEVIDHRRKSDHAVLVGDFNSLPGSPVDRLLQAQTDLVDAMHTFRGAAAPEQNNRASWPTAGFMNARMAIDRIYSSKAVSWLDFDGSRPFGDGGDGFAGLSDHVPIVGRMKLAS